MVENQGQLEQYVGNIFQLMLEICKDIYLLFCSLKYIKIEFFSFFIQNKLDSFFQ